MQPSKEITIYDLAKALDISPATVSRGLKDHPAISHATKKRIQDAAREMGYRSNNFASNLRRQKTNTIGVMVHELNSSFITSVLSGIEKITTAAEYDIIIAHSSEDYKKEVANASNLFHKRVDGLITSLAYNTEKLDHFQPFIQKGIPLIFFDRVEPQYPGTKIVIDNFKAAHEITSHLIQQGCKRIVHIAGSLKRNVYSDRLKGYFKALTDHKIKPDETLVIENDLSEAASVEAAQKILAMNPLPDAVFVSNDFAAVVCMQTLKEKGIRIPQDMAFAGFNNDAIGRYAEPRLTTINYPGVKMGEIVASHMISHLNGQTNIMQTSTVIIKSELIARESSLKKGASKK
ncbi:transcriptional regulator, LacI family [Filimonas lacunae]|uniref:Transcriptional regulator, LacI family n=1 Tax=Filimonas lacunae TaxID=477680 RepID=A0A173MQ16_9BACT|nr:LacI family DNA-binding transcriptional regulator [Filimonas lacunae]BAV09540.1 LacI family transcriptional regulator [Filimonas lacunae]SIS74912.1 transcriptional regulator, LacI family [Filimonas lacunae]